MVSLVPRQTVYTGAIDETVFRANVREEKIIWTDLPADYAVEVVPGGLSVTKGGASIPVAIKKSKVE